MQLDGAVGIVTGGAVRLGRALSLGLAEQGVRVGVHYGTSDIAARAVVEEIRVLGGQALAVQADLSQPKEAPSLVDRVAAHFGRVDVLVNSAAIFEPGGWDDTTLAGWDRHVAINLTSPFFLSQAFARQVGPGRTGHIVNIADWRGERPGADHIAYAVTKSALIGLTRSLAVALAPDIQVNAIAPGLILPPPGEGPEYLAARAAGIPARRVGSPQEVVHAMTFLLRSDFVTGDVVSVTGGQHL